jgi:hypothetical protein
VKVGESEHRDREKMTKVAWASDWRNTARLYALIAPQKRLAVILRRGPTNHVRMISWDLARDEFTPGQWIKKRVYERRCDLSSDGRYFIYFAAGYTSPIASWTAISKPPYFTALSLWPKGDGWGGGGLFSWDRRTIYLNHMAYSRDDLSLLKGFTPPPMRVLPLYENSGGGEDDPIRYYRMIRDGWIMSDKGSRSKSMRFGARYHYEQKKPTIFEKRWKKTVGRTLWTLQMSSKYTGEKQGRWNVEEARIVGASGETVLELGRIDWCDLDHNGDILWAWAGKLWRLKYSRNPRALILRQPILLADFNDMVFENVEAPAADKKW